MRRWYDPLMAQLFDQLPEITEVTVFLEEIANLAGEPLPASAYARTSWWSTGRGTIGTSLARVGWRVLRFDRHAHAVTFVRLPRVGAP